MAVRCTPLPIVIEKSGPMRKPVSRLLMLAHTQISLKKTPLFQIRSSFRNKVYEDKSKGIVCYRDENGEITCEGYDEGPRLQQHFSTINYCNTRDAENTDLELQQKSWLQILEGGEIKHADDKSNVGEQKDINCNGFNTTFY